MRKMENLPDLPTLTMIALAIAAIASAIEAFKSRPAQLTNEAATPNYQRLALTAAVTLTYLILLQLSILDFRLTTFAFIFTTCLILGGLTKRNLIQAAALGAVMAIGIHFVFTTIFTVDLPSA